MLLIGALASGEIPTSNEMADGLFMLNSMVDNWSTRRFIQTSNVSENFALTASQQSYTIRSGGNFSTEPPFKINDIFIRDSWGSDSPVEEIQVDAWGSLEDKNIATGRPRFYYYSPGLSQQATQAGTLYLYPKPDSSTTYTLHMTSQKLFTEFSSQSDTVTFNKAYTRALVFNLAIEIAPMYERSVLPDVQRIAFESLKYLININSKVPNATFDLPNIGGKRYNINSDM